MQAQRLPAGLLLDQSTMFLEMSIAVQTQRVLFSDPQNASPRRLLVYAIPRRSNHRLQVPLEQHWRGIALD